MKILEEKYIRNCPNCECIIEYSQKKGLIRANKCNASCKSCSMKGISRSKKFTKNEIKIIKKTYINGKTANEIGLIFNVSRETILRILKNNNVRVSLSYDIPANELLKEYDKLKNLKKLAKKFNCSVSTIRRKLKENNIDFNKNNSEKLKREDLYYLYVEKGLTTIECAKILNVSTYVINRDAKYYKFKRTQSEGSINSYRKRKLPITRCKRFVINNLTCTGTFEKMYVENLIKEGKTLPKKPNQIKTNLGYYFPDFEFDDKYIEIKGEFTYKICKGLVAWSKKGIKTDKQFQKILWVSQNIKPVEIIVLGYNGEVIKKELYGN